MKYFITFLLTFLISFACNDYLLINSPIGEKPLLRIRTDGNLYPVPHGGLIYGSTHVNGLADDIQDEGEYIRYSCTIACTGNVTGVKKDFRTTVKTLNLETDSLYTYVKKGIDPSKDCFKLSGCNYQGCASDSFLYANGLYCFPDSSYDLYYTYGHDGGKEYFDTLKQYRIAFGVTINTPSSTPEPKQDNFITFGICYQWKGFWTKTYMTSFITNNIKNKLRI